MGREINIAFVTDENYFKHMFVAIESILRNMREESKITFYILDLGIHEESIKLIQKRYTNHSTVKIEFIKVDNSNLLKYAVKTHVSISAYAKIYIPDLIKVDKLIYLDCDLIVNADITKLWSEFESEVCVKAVWDPFYNYDNKYLGIDNMNKTFNSGVMLLNLNLMREMNASLKLKTFLDKYHDKTKLHDQAAFNAIFKEHWRKLDLTWNCQVSILQNNYKKLNISKKEYRQLYKNAQIIHFTSNSKPWHFRNRHPYKKIYKDFYQAIFDELQYKDINIKSLLQMIKEGIKYKYYYILNLI